MMLTQAVWKFTFKALNHAVYTLPVFASNVAIYVVLTTLKNVIF